MAVSKNSGTPKWMVYFMENPIKMDDLGGKNPIFGLTPMFETKKRHGVTKKLKCGFTSFRIRRLTTGNQHPQPHLCVSR